MKLDRTKNAKRNIIFGFLLRIYTTLVPFVIRTIMIYYVGMEYLGLSSLFSSVLQVLNLAELGVGSAMVYSMYRPIAEDNREQICALLKMYKTYYLLIGAIIAVIGLALIPFLPALIKGEVPSDINIYILYLLNLATTVISYWGFAYKSSIASAHQRRDILNILDMVVVTVQYTVQIFVLIVYRNYYLYTLVFFLAQLLNNIGIGIVIDKVYPHYRPRGKLKNDDVKKINKRIRDLFTSKLGAVIVNSADSIVISACLGLTALAVYQNYYFILTTIIGFVSIVFDACTAGLGNSIVVDTKGKIFADLKVFTFIIVWIAGFCTTCFLCMYQPFMKVWAGEKYLLSFSMVICFCVYFFVYEINQLLNTYKDAAGLWSKDKLRPLATASTNLILNLVMVNYIGLFGILLSTILSTLFVGMPWLLHNLFTELFDKEDLAPYVRGLFRDAVVVAIGCLFTLLVCVCIPLDGVALIIARAAVCCVIPNAWYLVCFRGRNEFRHALHLMDVMLNGKVCKLLKRDAL